MPDDHGAEVGRWGARTVILRRVAVMASGGAAVWGLVFGFVIVASVTGYASAYPTAADRAGIADSLGANPGVQALLGVPHRLDTVAGFVAWRSLGTMAIIGGVWALLAATRLLRGEEDAGRWELLLSGQTDRRRAALGGCLGLGVGLLVLWLPVAVLAVAIGRSADAGFSVTASLFLAVALVTPAAMFLAIGALCSQIAATRRQASGLAAGVLGASFIVRLVADSGTGLRWMAWASPLGWTQALRPLTGSDLAPLVLIAGLIAGTVVLTVVLAGRRDLGGSTLPDRATGEPRTRLLAGPLTFAVRLARGGAIAWVVGMTIAGFIFGLVAKAAGDALSSSSSAAEMLARIGGHSAGAKAYLGVAFVIVSSLAGLQAAGLVAASREEEGDGHLDNLLVRPVRRLPWLAGRLLVATVALTATVLVAAVSAWVAAATQHSGVGLGSMLGAGINVLPAGLVVLGIGTLAHGFLPRQASMVAYGVVGWSFLVEMIGGIVRADHWFLDTSLLHHLAPAPSLAPRWDAWAVLVGLGLLAAAAGAARFDRRDLSTA